MPWRRQHVAMWEAEHQPTEQRGAHRHRSQVHSGSEKGRCRRQQTIRARRPRPCKALEEQEDWMKTRPNARLTRAPSPSAPTSSADQAQEGEGEQGATHGAVCVVGRGLQVIQAPIQALCGVWIARVEGHLGGGPRL